MHHQPGAFVLTWLAMMLGMMAPAGVLLVRGYAGMLAPGAPRAAGVAAYAAGYLGVWAAFGVIAGVAHAALEALGFMASDRLASTFAASNLVAAAGVYQFTPWKDACASHCRNPREFLAAHWRDGTRGALGLGALHGASCVGCCWLLFAALFGLGIMSTLWMAVLFAIILGERLRLLGPWVARGAGAAAVFYAGLLVAGA